MSNLFMACFNEGDLTPGIELVVGGGDPYFLVGNQRVPAMRGFEPNMSAGALLSASFCWLQTRLGESFLIFDKRREGDDGHYVLVQTSIAKLTDDIGCFEGCVPHEGADIGLMDKKSGDALIYLKVGGCVTYFLRDGRVFRLFRSEDGSQLLQLSPEDAVIAHCTHVEQLAMQLSADEYRSNERFKLFWQLIPLVTHYADVPEALNLLVGFLAELREKLSERMRERLVDKLQELGHSRALEFAIGHEADLSNVTFLNKGRRTAVQQREQLARKQARSAEGLTKVVRSKKGGKGDGSQGRRA
jgi:hypothetical protein